MIGETLMVAEAANWGIGVPWLPPTATVRRLAKKCDSPLDEFVRLSLVSVNTTILEEYCDDLETCPPDESSAKLLHLRLLSNPERFALCGMFFLMTFGVCGAGAIWLGTSSHLAFFSATLTATAAGALAAFCCLEPQRRSALNALLYREISRRKGNDPDGSNRLNLVSIET